MYPASSNASRGSRFTPVLGIALVGGLFLLAGCTTYRERPQIPAPVTIDQILTMTKAGDPPDEIIRQMRNSGTVYRLDASQLARLHEEGVADPVIDYMQQTYLAAVRRSARLENWDYWYRGPGGYWYGGIPYGWPWGWYWPDGFFSMEGGGYEHYEGHEGGHHEAHEGEHHGGRNR